MSNHVNPDQFDTRDTYERAAEWERERGRRAYESAREDAMGTREDH